MPAYTIDKTIETVANKIIAQHRKDLAMLKICYMFRETAAISDDKTIAGMCCKVDDRNKTVHAFDFLIEIAKDVWDEASDEFRLALIDHELGHVGIRYNAPNEPAMDEKTGRLKTYVRRHDVEEFEDVLERHGAYHKGLRDFLDAFAATAKAAKKKKSPLDDDE